MSEELKVIVIDMLSAAKDLKAVDEVNIVIKAAIKIIEEMI